MEAGPVTVLPSSSYSNYESCVSRLRSAFSVNVNIKSVNFNGVKCYYISLPSFNDEQMIVEIYDSKNGFLIYNSGLGATQEKDGAWSSLVKRYTYEVGGVTDSDVAKPDVSSMHMLN